MDRERQERLIRFFDKMTPEMEDRLFRLIEDDHLLLFMAWVKSAKVVGSGISLFSMLVRKSIMALVWILVPFTVLKWLLTGEVTLTELFKWLGK